VALELSQTRKGRLISLLCCEIFVCAVEAIWAGICESTVCLRSQRAGCHPGRGPWWLVEWNLAQAAVAGRSGVKGQTVTEHRRILLASVSFMCALKVHHGLVKIHLV